MANRRINKDRILTNLELQHRFQDAIHSIDKQLDEAFENINWKRRKTAEKSLPDWVNTYCIPLLLNDPPPKKGEQVLLQMQHALTAHSNYMICMPRGHGKSSYVCCATLYAIATGLQKYVVCISNNTRAASGLMNDIWKAIAETDTIFAQDYPEVCVPFHLCNGSFRRKQTYHGRLTEMQKNASNLVLANLYDENNKPYPTANSIITCRGISGGLRGMKFGNLRPSLILLDDLQTSEMAGNAEQVDKLLTLIKKDILNLGGKQRVSVLQTATPIVVDDLVEQIKNDIHWKTTIFKAIESYPKNKALWKEYFKLYDAETISEKDHSESLQFYKDNRKEMDEGSDVFNETQYSESDGHISTIQKLLEIEHVIGNSAFQSEYQMSPVKATFSINITPKHITDKISPDFKELDIPDGFVYTAGAIDLNTSYAATCSIVTFKPDTTSHVIYHHIFPMRIDQKLPDAEYNQQLQHELTKIFNQLKALNIKLDGVGIDSGSRNWDAVCQFTKTTLHQFGIPSCAMAGRSSTQFNPYVRSRLRDSINNTVLCGDSKEHVKSGAGNKYMFFNADYYKEMVHKSLTAPIGASGSCSLYFGDIEEHKDFAIQICNEKIKFIKHLPNGKYQYYFVTKEPHDYLDTMSMCFAVAASQGISGTNVHSIPAKRQSIKKMPHKPKIKII